jgi:hypothetical protein
VEICENLLRKYTANFAGRECAVVMNMRVYSSISMQACSACAGDYEDPDRTAGEELEDLLAGDEEYELQGDEEECDGLDGFDGLDFR